MNGIVLQDFFDLDAMRRAQAQVHSNTDGISIVVGAGATILAGDWDVLIYADMARWEIQKRQRSEQIGNLGVNNLTEAPSLKYKRAFFVDWRAADRLKKQIWTAVDFFLDTNDQNRPKLISGDALRNGLRKTANRPFRVVPYFDPGPWGGHWIEEVCDLPKGEPNYAWCFDCVPEENESRFPRSIWFSLTRENFSEMLSTLVSGQNFPSALTFWTRWAAEIFPFRFIR